MAKVDEGVKALGKGDIVNTPFDGVRQGAVVGDGFGWEIVKFQVR
jgi:hypothetical protein